MYVAINIQSTRSRLLAEKLYFFCLPLFNLIRYGCSLFVIISGLNLGGNFGNLEKFHFIYPFFG